MYSSGSNPPPPPYANVNDNDAKAACMRPPGAAYDDNNAISDSAREDRGANFLTPNDCRRPRAIGGPPPPPPRLLPSSLPSCERATPNGT